MMFLRRLIGAHFNSGNIPSNPPGLVSLTDESSRPEMRAHAHEHAVRPGLPGLDPKLSNGEELRQCCTHCRSYDVQEAYRTSQAIVFRCLHCWKVFVVAPR